MLKCAIDNLEVFHHRSGLSKTIQKIKSGILTIGFIGGSITESLGGHNWPETVISWFCNTYPHLRLIIENCAIGATASDLAVFRAERDLIDRGCDLVFIEYAVNDEELTTEVRNRTREGLLRKLLTKAECDLVVVYTYRHQMYDEIVSGQVPGTIAEFEVLCEHYGIGSIWAGLWAFNEVRRGEMRWEVWLPDRISVHPHHRGSFSYAQSVIKYLKNELIDNPSSIQRHRDIRDALNPNNWEHTYILPFSEVNTVGPWSVQRWSTCNWIDQVLATSSPGAELDFIFKGRGLSLGFDFGKFASEYDCEIDGKKIDLKKRPRHNWCPDEGLYSISNIIDDMELKEHHCKMKVVHGGDEAYGTNFRLAFIGVIS